MMLPEVMRGYLNLPVIQNYRILGTEFNGNEHYSLRLVLYNHKFCERGLPALAGRGISHRRVFEPMTSYNPALVNCKVSNDMLAYLRWSILGIERMPERFLHLNITSFGVPNIANRSSLARSLSA